MTKLTIIIPAFNVEKFILNALNSIKLQEVDDSSYEVLIINDGSIDNTELVVQNWINENNVEKNFKYFYKKNGNWGSVINYAKNHNLINGEYITILDADDYYSQNCFRIVYDKLDGYNDLVISNYFQNKNGKLKKAKVIFGNTSKNIDPLEAHTGYSIPLCKFFKTSKFMKMNPLIEKISFQDQILYHTFVLNSKKIYFINEWLGIYWVDRAGSSSASLWTDQKVHIWAQNMNTLLSYRSESLASYVSMMIWFVKKNMLKKQWPEFKIDQQYHKLLKNATYLWLPKQYRNIARWFFNLNNKKLLNS